MAESAKAPEQKAQPPATEAPATQVSATQPPPIVPDQNIEVDARVRTLSGIDVTQ